MTYRYLINVYYRLPNCHDSAIRKAAGRDEWASGAGMGERDLSFEYKSAAVRDRAAERIKRLVLSSPLRVECRDYQNEEG